MVPFNSGRRDPLCFKASAVMGKVSTSKKKSAKKGNSWRRGGVGVSAKEKRLGGQRTEGKLRKQVCSVCRQQFQGGNPYWDSCEEVTQKKKSHLPKIWGQKGKKSRIKKKRFFLISVTLRSTQPKTNTHTQRPFAGLRENEEGGSDEGLPPRQTR